MRMCCLSASRQPCSAFSCIAVTMNSPPGCHSTAVCEPFHSRKAPLAFSAPIHHSVTPL